MSSNYDDDYYAATSYGYEPAEYSYADDTSDLRKSNSKISYARHSSRGKSGKPNANAKGGQAAASYYSYYRQRSVADRFRQLLLSSLSNSTTQPWCFLLWDALKTGC